MTRPAYIAIAIAGFAALVASCFVADDAPGWPLILGGIVAMAWAARGITGGRG